jgi:hypothetical protein
MKVLRPFISSHQDNPLHSLDSHFVFTTEGHPIHLSNGYKKSTPSDIFTSTCQVPPSSTGLFSAILSIPDAFHPFTPNTTLNTNFIPLLDTKGFSSPRTILEVSTIIAPLIFRSLILYSHHRNLCSQTKRVATRKCPFYHHYERQKASRFPI